MSQNQQSRIQLSCIALMFVVLTGCAGPYSVQKTERDYFYDHSRLSNELDDLELTFPAIVEVQSIGETYEGRSIPLVKITGNNPDYHDKPALLAIFAEHSAEHDGTILAMGLIRFLLDQYGASETITRLLDEKELYVVPMMNPDGVDYDLSGMIPPFTWRKNRRPTGPGTYGVDLNRNWGHTLSIPVPEELAADLGDKTGPYYAGDEPFSESETRAVRDFLLEHPNVSIFVDHHTGGGGILQGMTIVPISVSEDESLPASHETRYLEVARRLAEELSDPHQKDPPFVVHTGPSFADTIWPYVPWYLAPFFPKEMPYPPGVSADWVYGQLGIMAFGVESVRPTDFFRKLPESNAELVEN